MNARIQTIPSVLNESNLHNFIHLKGKVFAEYTFIYHINDGFSIKKLSNFSDKYQFLFKKISSKVKQLNLMLVDTIFPILLADVVLDVFLKNISSFSEYSNSKKAITINDTTFDKKNMEYKFKYFIHRLLQSNIATEEIYKGIIKADKIYYLKNQNKEIEFYTIYEQNELIDLLFHKMTLEINLGKSSINKNEVNICLKMFFS